MARESAESWTKAVSFLPTVLLLFAAVALLVGEFANKGRRVPARRRARTGEHP